MENLIKYREKHPRCKYCKYKRYVNNTLCGVSYVECILKDRLLNDIILWNLKGMFCRWYKPKEVHEL